MLIHLHIAFLTVFISFFFFFFQAEDGIRDLVRSRGLGDVYKRQVSVAGAVPVSTPAAQIGLRSTATLAKVPGKRGHSLSLIHI